MNYKPGTYALLAAVGIYETPELCQLPGYAGGGNIPETHILTFEDAIRAFAGKGIVLMASSAADRQAWLTEDGSRSLYTDLFSRSILSRRLIRKGKIALSDVHKEISYLTEKWNHLHPEKTQNPVYRDNLVGTIYFDVEEYRPYIPEQLLCPAV